MKKYVLAMDQGTTSCRGILFDRSGTICGVAQKEFAQIYPQPGWVEHDPLLIWETQLEVSKEAIRKAGALTSEVAAIGITDQRETTVVWERATGKPIYNAIVWQCRRTAEAIEKLTADGLGGHVKETTGLIPDAYFSASKLAWILDHAPGSRERAAAGELLFGTIDSWLIWNLTGGRVHVTDRTNAARTMLFDIHKLCWDKELLEYFDIPECMLPQVVPSSQIYGLTDYELFGCEIPIAGAAGDQQAALFGQCCFSPGDVKNTYGTGCFLLMNTGDKPVVSEKGMLTTIAASASDQAQYALEGSIFSAGSAVQWLRDELRIISSAGESEAYAASVPDTGGVYLVPAFTGLGAPHWDPYARGTIVGITRGTSREHIVRATLESMAYQTSDILEIMEEESGIKLSGLKVDGGASNNNFLMQFQADILGTNVLRPGCVETTALGAAYLAGLAVGYWESLDDIKKNWQLEGTFRPEMENARREELKRGWKKAVSRSLGWAREDA